MVLLCVTQAENTAKKKETIRILNFTGSGLDDRFS